MADDEKHKKRRRGAQREPRRDEADAEEIGKNTPDGANSIKMLGPSVGTSDVRSLTPNDDDNMMTKDTSSKLKSPQMEGDFQRNDGEFFNETEGAYAVPHRPPVQEGVSMSVRPRMHHNENRGHAHDGVNDNMGFEVTNAVGQIVGGAMHDMASMMRGMAREITKGVNDAVTQAPILHAINQYESAHSVPNNFSTSDQINRANRNSEPLGPGGDPEAPAEGSNQTPPRAREPNDGRHGHVTDDDMLNRSAHRRHRATIPMMHDSLESDNSESEISERSSCTRRNRRNNYEKGHTSKLSVFTGKERWEVWFNRFQDIATRQKWY